VSHDNTNVPLLAPSDADLNRSLFSDYYNETCAKGGTALQRCGWILAIELATGRIPDSVYIELVEIFEEQKAFAQQDKDLTEEGFIELFIIPSR
jgi:hypothetical protein